MDHLEELGHKFRKETLLLSFGVLSTISESQADTKSKLQVRGKICGSDFGVNCLFNLSLISVRKLNFLCNKKVEKQYKVITNQDDFFVCISVGLELSMKTGSSCRPMAV